jgi:AhpD family alkylhydroperoxidase
LEHIPATVLQSSAGEGAGILQAACLTVLASTHQEVNDMSRADVHAEMKELFGEVVPFIDLVPDQFIDSEWDLVKRLQLGETLIPNKYKELMGLAVSAVTRCRYCALFHTEAAKLFGATDDEVEEAMHYTKLVIGWSTYINGMQVDYDEFKAQVDRVVEHVRAAA